MREARSIPHRPGTPPRPGEERPAPAWRRWAFPLAAATLVPMALLGGVELGLRAAGLGHPTAFFLPIEGQPAVTTNLRFGWRFFPPAIARSPVIDRLAHPKPAGTYRIFVLGGSAAMGTPEPAFSFGRVLAVLLEERYPAGEFEVVNAAMAAINSHVVLEIARDCARRQPDLFAVYLGNNEVVGPYGPGTVFAPAGGGLPAIRLGLRLRRMRGGQLLARGLASLDGQPAAPARWRGMEMFRERHVAADDPRLERTYEQLRRNLTDIAGLAAVADAPLLLSTVAVDLRDTPPFASVHGAGLGEAELERWQALLEHASELAAAGRPEAARAALDSALGLDDRHAELQYRIGRLELLAGNHEAARHHLSRARDLDALRFRADTRINDTIRRVAADASGRVQLVDAERVLAEAPESVAGLPGSELFWEHVHLRFLGNYRLARAFLDQLAPLLPAAVRGEPASMASPARVAELLGLTARDRWQMAATIHDMTRRPPFIGQLGHGRRRQATKRTVLRLRAEASAARQATLETHRRALERRPDDIQLLRLRAAAIEAHGAPDEAVAAWSELVRRLPDTARWRTRLGFALAAAGDHAGAVAELRRALDLVSESADARVNLGTVLEEQGETEAARALYEEALLLDPGGEAARVNLATLLDRTGRPDEAEGHLRELIRLAPSSATAHRRLGELQHRHGDLGSAIASYRRALELDDELAAVHNNLGYLLAETGETEKAAREYLAALDDDPSYALAYFNLGDLLLELGRAAEAAEAYRGGLARRPDNEQARANLEQAERLAAAP